MKINIEQLENILIAHWTEFLNPREIIKLINSQPQFVDTNLIKNIKITRFELSNNKFIIWVEFEYNSSNALLELESDIFNELNIKNILF